ncbi:MAG: acyl-CoA dehydrogenase [Hirschia sp.]|nr:acyl-CoA dehydrogenase [Hirschia sp.]MBF19701.1 acyl-CoA dehydrogenase [Hirschia sp.]
MTSYNAPLRDMQFILKEMLEIQTYQDLPGFEEVTEDLIDAILEEGGKYARDVLHPLNKVGDAHGCVRNDDGSVTTPPGFKDAYDAMVESGFTAMAAKTEYGGQGLPHVLNVAYSEMSSAANMAFSMYPGLTHGAYSAIEAGGSDAQKNTYLPNLATGKWGGTMNLTEPQCGTDLGLIRTKAVPQADGTYKITGQKIWISAGEHDMADNIIHLVLARIEGAPEGIKGISLFIVPKYILDENGEPGARNSLECGGLEEKMGIHGNATCVMNYEDATGWLIGDENKGMRVMFVMMNAARLAVGVQGLAQAELAYQNAAEFARERLQSRSLTGPKAPDKPADPIIVHPDVRRMLMDSKAFIEGGRAFAYWTMLFNDLEHLSPDEKVREKASDYMGLMTPVVKSFLTDKGFKACSDCLQVHGGTGFTKDQGVEQFLRDAKIAMIYEGTNGIQALDLVGRKLSANAGRSIFGFFKEIDEWCEANSGDEELKPFVDALGGSKAKLQEGTTWLMQNGMSDFNNAGAASHDYLNVFGYTALTYMWAKMAKIALAKKGSDPFYDQKLVTGRYFIERLLPEAGSHLEKLKTGAKTMMSLDAEMF